MKKIAFAAAALVVAGFGAQAQQQVLKDAERAMKGGKTLQEVVSVITPAFTNAETQSNPQTYFIPGKAAFAEYDKLLVNRQLGANDEKTINTMVNNLIEGYNYFLKALPLDSVPNEKGKVKPKYSKEIWNTLSGHYMDYNNAAVDAWNAKNYQAAYNAWGVIVDLPENQAFLKAYPKDRLFPDSTRAELAFNQGLAAWQLENLDGALAAFNKAKGMGYAKKSLYDYAISVATQAKKPEVVVAWANEALPLYGKEDDSYIRQIINSQLEAGKFAEALSSIEAAIAEDPNNSQYQWVLGVIYNYRKDDVRKALPNDVKADDPKIKEIETLHNQAKAAFQKAIELDANNASAYQALGALVYEDYQVADNSAPAGYSQKYFDDNMAPILRRCAELYEKAAQINPEDVAPFRALETIYYNLNDNANMERVKALKQAL